MPTEILIAIPCYLEGSIIEASLNRVVEYCDREFGSGYRIVVAENGSKDQTEKIVAGLDNPKIFYCHTVPGKGSAVIEAWMASQARSYVFLDADLSTDLRSLSNLIRAISEGGYDIATGSRFIEESKVNRGFTRRFMSITLNIILRIFFHTSIRDTTCGFKAVNKKVVDELLPKIKNRQWFFDTELLILAEKNKFRIKEIPVEWSDDREKRDSKVEPLKLSLEYLKEIIRLKKRIGRR